MPASHIDFWFTMGSTYSYLSVMRLVQLERLTGIRFRWRPFHLLVILQEMKHVPFADKPTKFIHVARYRATRGHVWHTGVASCTVSGATIHYGEPRRERGYAAGLGRRFCRAAYRRWLQLGQETGSEPNLSESLRDIGVDPQPALALANTAEAKAALMEETGVARDLGIFGSPTFAIGRELFWGHCDLEDAISWYRYRSVRSLTLLDFPEPDSLRRITEWSKVAKIDMGLQCDRANMAIRARSYIVAADVGLAFWDKI